MTINLADFDFGTVDNGEVRTARINVSAFQRAGRKIALPLTGATISVLSGVKSKGVKEGGAKTASGANSSFKVLPNKLVSVVVLTDEAWAYNESIVDAIFEQQPSAHAYTFDGYMSGLEAIPAEVTGFGTLKDAQTVTIGTGLTAVTDFDKVDELLAGNTEAAVLTSAMLSYFRRQRVGDAAAKAFEVIEGKTAEGADGTINGIPFYKIRSATAVGFFGEFSKLNWGEVELSAEMANSVKNAGNIFDDNGVEHNLTSENKSALFNEVMVGAGIEALSSFVKVIPAPVV